ncbi:HAD hydrolase-like protein [Streptococcus pacificus]|uniref:HAD hydrolase-like protein n=1 Tax=Streptococcus pacificus TaxID=2740577 RepID=A0ABS0ZI08_9STRE|nr:HAD hydrolase-like protein [Streptococcus pacificus]MBJ8325639.1 HAD hydrolase-like protein [Streptococcus pacificus]
MTTFIWDLDGTLIDSYDAMLASIEVTYKHFNWSFEREPIKTFILEESIGKLLFEKSIETGISFELIKKVMSEDVLKRDDEFRLMPGALSILEWTRSQGIKNFMYTHKGDNTFSVLKKLGISDYFEEVLTGDSGFKRKPDPEAVDYLVDKYHFDKASAYYIGDRKLDKELAVNSGIKSINLGIETSKDNQHIKTLEEIKQLF